MRSIHDAVKTTSSLTPAVHATTSNGDSVDTKGFTDAELIVLAGAVRTPHTSVHHYTVRVQESSDGSTGWSNVTDVDGSNVEVVAKQATNDFTNTVHSLRIGQLGRLNRYLRARVEMEGAQASVRVGAAIALGRAFQEPVDN